MGNDIKVNRSGGLRIQSPEVGLFLRGNTLINAKEIPELYNLDVEYAKSRKNRSWFIILLMLGVAAVVGLLTVIITHYISEQNKQIEVGIDVFEDLNLKKLLDVVTRTETSLNDAISDKSRLEHDKQSALDELSIKHENDLFLIQSMNIKSADKNQRIAAIDEEYQINCASVEQKFDKQITEADVRIAEFQKQLSEMDGKNVAMAQEQKAAIDSQRQLFEIEKQKIVDDYETQIADLRDQLQAAMESSSEQQRSAVGEIATEYQTRLDELDPVVSNIQGKRILDNLATQESAVRFTDQEIDLENYPAPFIDAFDKMRRELSDFDKIWAIVAAVPQENSIPSYVKALKQLAYSTGTTIGNGAIESAGILVEQYESQIEQYKSEIEQYKSQINELSTNLTETKEQLASLRRETSDMYTKLKASQSEVEELNRATEYFNNDFMSGSEAGYVIAVADSDSLSNILVYVNPIYNDVADGAKAYVYRSAEQQVATVTLKYINGFMYAQPFSADETGDVSSIQAGDFFVLDLTSR